ncbi:MAG: AmmeMemoRadiSam system protein B, partial [Calditrichota bacterium]
MGDYSIHDYCWQQLLAALSYDARELQVVLPECGVQTDRKFIQRWNKRLGHNASREEFMHRSEHSIEFQLPFLQHGLKRDFEVVNILSGSLEYALNYA